MTARHIHHLAVLVRDLEQAEAFYVGVVGLPVERRWYDDRGAPRSVWLSLGDGAFLAVEKAPTGLERDARNTHDAHDGEARQGWHCVAFAIQLEEREPMRRRFAASGFPIERETSYTLYARDPEGNVVALSHYPTSAPDTGTSGT